MRKAVLIILAACLIAFGADKTASLIDGKCSICSDERQKSTVTMDGPLAITAMYCGSGHYDENGNFVPPPACNTATQTGRCSRGHVVIDSGKR